MGSFEVISRVALCAPVDAGLKATLIVKVLSGLIVLLPPPLVIANIEASVPVMVEVDIERLAIPLLLTVKEALSLRFTFTLP